MKKCDLIVVSWNHLEFLRPCVEHIIENTRSPYRLIVADNASDAEIIGYLDKLKANSDKEITLVKNDKNLGFVKAVNQGLRISNAPYVCIFNNDTLPGEGWLMELVDFAEKHPDAGLFNPVCGGHIEEKLSVNEYAKKLLVSNKGKYMEMNQCQGFCMLVKRELIEKIGYLDEQFDTVGFDDTDYSMRAHLLGYKSLCVQSSYVYHREHASFGKMGDRKKIQSVLENRYFAKWPRHLRIAIIFSISEDTSDEKIENLLNSVLFLAREWCWINLLIFGKKEAKEKIEAIKRKINFPVHQNLKFNYLNKNFKALEITVRLLERSFGRKSRKRYDAVIYHSAEPVPFLKFLCSIQKCFPHEIDFTRFSKDKLESLLSVLRKEGLKEKTPLKCDIILPVYNQCEVTKKCIESIIRNTDTPYRLIIVSNGKDPKTKRFLSGIEARSDIEVTLVHNSENMGWVKSLNLGIKLSNAPYVCFQNNDTIVTAGWLRKLINILKLREDFGLINPTWGRRPAGMSIEKYNGLLEKKKKGCFVETDWCRGFSVVIKREVVERIGQVDEVYGLGYLDDVDYSVRAIEAGFITLCALDTYVYHQRNVTASEIFKEKWNEKHDRNERIYHKKWGRPLKIVVILNKEACVESEALNQVEESIFYLARKQHHIDIWSPRKFKERFKHTNIRVKTYPFFILPFLVSIDLRMNRKKREKKRYDAIFRYDSCREPANLTRTMKETVDRLKEKTKELIDVRL